MPRIRLIYAVHSAHSQCGSEQIGGALQDIGPFIATHDEPVERLKRPPRKRKAVGLQTDEVHRCA